jgi:hypothetical protein
MSKPWPRKAPRNEIDVPHARSDIQHSKKCSLDKLLVQDKWPRRASGKLSNISDTKMLAPAESMPWSRCRSEDDLWVLKAYEKRKELKKKRELEQNQSQLPKSYDGNENATPKDSTNIMSIDAIFPEKVGEEMTNVEASLTVSNVATVNNSIEAREAKRTRVEISHVVKKNHVVDQKYTSCSTAKPLIKSKKLICHSSDLQQDEPHSMMNCSEWRKFAMKQQCNEIGSHTVSDNFIRLTMRKRLKGRSGNARKRPLYLRSAAYDKTTERLEDKNSKALADNDGIDVLEECMNVLSQEPRNPRTPDDTNIHEPFCYHGILAQRLVVKKKNQNCGRAFFVCTRTFDEGRCDYFMWEQNHPHALQKALLLRERAQILPPLPSFSSPIEALRVLFGHADMKPGTIFFLMDKIRMDLFAVIRSAMGD